MQLGCCLLILLLFNFLIFVKLVGIDPLQIRISLVKNRTILVLQSIRWGIVPAPDKIGSGNGWNSIWAIEADWIWKGTMKVIRDIQHIRIIFHRNIIYCNKEILFNCCWLIEPKKINLNSTLLLKYIELLNIRNISKILWHGLNCFCRTVIKFGSVMFYLLIYFIIT